MVGNIFHTCGISLQYELSGVPKVLSEKDCALFLTDESFDVV